MSVEQKDIVNNLKNKVKKVLSLYHNLKTENVELNKEVADLKLQIKNKDSEIDFLKNKTDKLKVAKSILASTGNGHDAKIKINRIVREIDKCIALLNR